MYMNECKFIGRLGQKPEAKDAKGRAVMELSVAVPRKAAKGSKPETDWIRFVVWNQNLVKYLASYFDKGDEIYIVSHYQRREVLGADGTKKYYDNFVVDEVQKVTWKQATRSTSNEEIEVEDLGLTGEIPDFE